MRLSKSRFFLIAFLPNILFVFLLVFIGSISGKLSQPNIYGAIILADSGAYPVFIFLRNIFFVAYLVVAGYLTYEYLRAKKKNNKAFIRSCIIVITGIFLSLFAYFFSALAIDFYIIFKTLLSK